MALDLKALGDKIRRYREQLKESHAEVSDRTGIAPERLGAIEAGNIEPSGDEILILADHFRCDYRFFVSNERVAPFEQTEALYRSFGTEFTASDRRSIQEFLLLCEAEAFLTTELDRAGTEFKFTPSGKFYKRHGEDAAEAFRKSLGLADDEVPSNVYDCMRQSGVHVFRRKLGNSRISGVFLDHPWAGACALVNYSEDVYRQRFSAAHELAHAIFDRNAGPSVSFTKPPSADLVEVRANRFASCFLLPPALLRRLPDPAHWTEAQAVDYAARLKVSTAALAYALKEIGLLSADGERLITRARVPQERKSDPEIASDLTPLQKERKKQLLERGLSEAYVALCFDALRSGVISVGRLAELLLSSADDLPELAQMYGRALRVD